MCVSLQYPLYYCQYNIDLTMTIFYSIEYSYYISLTIDTQSFPLYYKTMKVAIIFGSLSDKSKMKGAVDCLDQFKVDYDARVLSAHRVPEALADYLAHIEKEGYEVIIAGAGCAAHLPGVIASKTILPVIGVPINASLDGMDALLSIVQMPKNIPVATVGIDNSFNAAMLAIQILAIKYPELNKRLIMFRETMKKTFLETHNTAISFT